MNPLKSELEEVNSPIVVHNLNQYCKKSKKSLHKITNLNEMIAKYKKNQDNEYAHESLTLK